MSGRRLQKASTAALALVVSLGGLVALTPEAEARPRFTVTTVARGLNIAWDITWVGDLMLFDQRAGAIFSKRGSAAPRRVDIPLPAINARGEGGLLGMVADPAAVSNRRFYTCQSVKPSASAGADVRVMRWRLTSDAKAVADRDKNGRSTLITGIPTGSGRHNGCRLRFGPDGKLYVGTGDAAVGVNPQRKQSLGGKILRVNADGTIPTDNPFYRSGGNARYVWNFGHRNLQGLAFRPGTGELWSAEHGTGRDDEINRNLKGANYGWDPVPGYDESTPMTDLAKFPQAVRAIWSSGSPTVATSGLTFLTGAAWGRWEGSLAVARLAGQGIQMTHLDPTGREVNTAVIPETTAYKRIRTVQTGPDGSLYFTTSNGGNADVIAKITPTAVPPKVPAGKNVSSEGVSAARTGGDLYAFIRTSGDQIQFKRSTDDGRTWPATWRNAGVTSTTAPAVASSGAGWVDLLVRGSNGRLTHVRFVNGVKAGSTYLGGDVTTGTISSVGDGTLDVFGVGRNGVVYRLHFGTSWPAHWERLSGIQVSSRVGAAADPKTKQTVITARGLAGETFVRTMTPGSSGTRWAKTSGQIWSARALGDVFPGRSRIAVSRTSDGYARLSRDAMTMALEVPVTGDADVVTRPDGTWVLFARSPAGSLTFYDARSGQYRPRSLGGTVR